MVFKKIKKINNFFIELIFTKNSCLYGRSCVGYWRINKNIILPEVLYEMLRPRFL